MFYFEELQLLFSLYLVVNLIAKMDKQNYKEISGALRLGLMILRIVEKITKAYY